MDHKSALEAVEAIRSTVPQDELVGFDTELVSRYGAAAEVAGSLSVSDTIEPLAATEAAPLHEAILDGFNTAYNSYSDLVCDANMRRDANMYRKVRGRKKLERLEVVDADTIRADVEAVLANPQVLAELQADVDHFTAQPETDSPEAGFRLVIFPEGLAEEDVTLAAHHLQQKLNSDYNEARVHPESRNDKRIPAVTGKGYRIAFMPTHYNVPRGTARTQTELMDSRNESLDATELQTATDAESLAFIDALNAHGELNNPSTRFDRRYITRRFDQVPRGGVVSRVYVDDDGRLNLGLSDAYYKYPTRALVVPKA